jgi:DNA-binding XRE family transcriptional regulator
MVVRTILPYQKSVPLPLHKDMPIVLKTLGAHIRKKRIESGLLQKDVADILHISIDTITGWENNRSQPQLKHYPAVIAFLGYNPLETPMLSFAQSIRQYRLRHGLSIARMGRLVGVNGSTILSWEKAEHVPLSHLYEKVLVILNTTPLIV